MNGKSFGGVTIPRYADGRNQRGRRGAPRDGRRENSHPNGRGSYHKPVISDNAAWSHLSELKLKLIAINGELPSGIYAPDVFHLLQRHGNIEKIDISTRTDATKPRAAIVTFAPPPLKAFWLNSSVGTISGTHLRAELLPSHQFNSSRDMVPRQFADMGICPISRLDFGFLYQDDHIISMRSIFAQTSHDFKLSVNAERLQLVISFCVDERYLSNLHSGLYSAPPSSGDQPSRRVDHVVRHEFKFQISFKQLQQIYERNADDNDVELVISQPKTSPPLFYMKMDPSSTMRSDDKFWSSNRAWFRRTSICDNDFGTALRETPLSLQEPDSFLNIGGWTTYRLHLTKATYYSDQFQRVRQMLQDHNIDWVSSSKLHVTSVDEMPTANPKNFWTLLPSSSNTDNASLLSGLSHGILLPWSVQYQLEVCIAKDLLNASNISYEFLDHLKSVPERKAVKILEHVADKGSRYYNPLELVSRKLPPTKLKKRVPANHVLQRSVTVKPSSIEPNTPSVEQSNRILRLYSGYGEYFIRIMFRDEKSEGKIFSSDDEINDALFNRVRRCLNHGIVIGDRHFEWLAWGNSQFREHGAYFFNAVGALTTHTIRSAMGNFSIDREVAKAAARMGQCFSTTRDYSGPVEPKQIEDVKTASHNFTDGVGKISPFLADQLNRQMKLPPYTSAYQYRFGGSKGVLVRWDEVKRSEIQLRPSQKKFIVDREKLEIIRGGTFVRAELNRQLITILSCLQVPDEVFISKLEEHLREIQTAMQQPEKADELLRKRADVNMITVNIADMVRAGFMGQKEPFVQTLLLLWRAWSHKRLKEKASVQIDDAAFVMGVTDETKTLRGHYNDRRALPEIFIQVPDPRNKTGFRVVEDTCILARNPSLHPGDIRIVRAVDNSRLHHLKNVVVFPQTGDQDLPSMCSGGDLDGDDYFISWDPTLLPPKSEWNHKPMTHTSVKPAKVESVSDEMVKDFFVRHMKQDALGKIANAWLAQADQLPDGPKHTTCKTLADLHSTAVDFPKTGHPAKGADVRRLRPKRYPHYLESNRPDRLIYHSHSIVGKLYDMVQRIDFHPILNSSFDSRILDKYVPDSKRDDAIHVLKAEYDAALRRIMAQFEITTESEIWSAFILNHGKSFKEYEIQSKVGNLVGAVKEKFREACIQKAGGRQSSLLWPFVISMYKHTAHEVSSTLQHIKSMYGYDDIGVPELQPQEMPMLSFPWIFGHELGQIANGIALPRAEMEHEVASPNSHQTPNVSADDRCARNGEGVSAGVLLEGLDFSTTARNSDRLATYKVVVDDQPTPQYESSSTALLSELDNAASLEPSKSQYKNCSAVVQGRKAANTWKQGGVQLLIDDDGGDDDDDDNNNNKGDKVEEEMEDEDEVEEEDSGGSLATGFRRLDHLLEDSQSD